MASLQSRLTAFDPAPHDDRSSAPGHFYCLTQSMVCPA
ncbi:hypothetical protein ALP33_04989 [Pseudomonas amygdali pv. lachrymans]|uniref:Uncharacterized protein n=1 Tax=Pseudomonas amygdali pv. lachrymans TaxID=53707 RepID=A0AB37R882_PSEAV|nr:Uncharacterized protein AC501_4861 [Pseudomonas amygdali pv. lachrymans]KPC18705.1 Uncharacterized protein AC499_3814 [Pseudomonas amygdali pv. lachrymans]RMM51872.1 hypothetical protein ALQ79_05541 [Pseudomonas amygdali pv. lachrymans]RMT13354.1 hypothetical protein ALP54_100438 [Pseudomonas amygdali pv. lachrymans]RMU19081.1 hypothetical protein ALP33_04989 [Pseudomonas amygdali pv. lachrymans]